MYNKLLIRELVIYFQESLNYLESAFLHSQELVSPDEIEIQELQHRYERIISDLLNGHYDSALAFLQREVESIDRFLKERSDPKRLLDLDRKKRRFTKKWIHILQNIKAT